MFAKHIVLPCNRSICVYKCIYLVILKPPLPVKSKDPVEYLSRSPIRSCCCCIRLLYNTDHKKRRHGRCFAFVTKYFRCQVYPKEWLTYSNIFVGISTSPAGRMAMIITSTLCICGRVECGQKLCSALKELLLWKVLQQCNNHIWGQK